ncbi:hypothetical protein Tco_0720286 [Tanacetum coccineum]
MSSRSPLLDVCVYLGLPPLTQTRMADFVSPSHVYVVPHQSAIMSLLLLLTFLLMLLHQEVVAGALYISHVHHLIPRSLEMKKWEA